MKISIITVSYNSAASIGDTLRSVASQSHPDIEHIVVDGGSTDGTQSLLRQEGRHLARWISEPDRGIYDAMNKGLAMATGDLIGFLNADDMFAEASTVTQIAKTAEDADVIYGDLVYVSANDTRQVVRMWRSGRFSRLQLKFGWMPPHPTFYVRRSVLEKVGRFDTALRIAADYDFMLRTLALPDLRVAGVSEVLVRMRTGGASNRSLKAMLRKSSEDLLVLRRSGVGGMATLLCKNLRKLPQFISR
ncbi:glycosyltransferase family 2 protein [Paucibacter sp. APW11]|uniref:Glycosyltransferase family 2 protein n=1 Tax=Roseateles aquae TaxID=3077235 RepID=A0ABU3PFC6_9BURK|nr:glycosyltransferase family 2 protein [Paucibacter sp. APW11]MDT9001256.1 glycosyltransferase family 2 protein [Paucibacter sp. APW11]